MSVIFFYDRMFFSLEKAFLAKWTSLISLQPPSSWGWQLPSKQAAASGYTVWPLDFPSVIASQILHRLKRNDGGLSSLFNIVPESLVSLWSSVAGRWFSIMQEVLWKAPKKEFSLHERNNQLRTAYIADGVYKTPEAPDRASLVNHGKPRSSMNKCHAFFWTTLCITIAFLCD